MNKKRKVDDVLESIFNLIQEAHKELKESEKNGQNHNNLLIEKEKSINVHKSLIKEKKESNSKSRDDDWSNLNFKRIEFAKDQNTTYNAESKEIKQGHWLSDDYIKKVFFDSLKDWNKKNLKNLTENTYQEIIKESLKKN